MAPRGKLKRSKHRQKFNKNTKNPKSKRKKFNLKQLETGKNVRNAQHSRPKQFKKITSAPETTIENQPTEMEYSSSESEEEVEDNIKQLLGTFNTDMNKGSLAIESDESISDIEDVADEASDTEKVCDLEDGSDSASSDEMPDELEGEDENDPKNLEDPFAIHLLYELNNNLLSSVQNVPMTVENHAEDWPLLGKLHIQIPFMKPETTISNTILSDEKRFATSGKVPVRLSKTTSTLDSIHVKPQIITNIEKANKVATTGGGRLGLTSFQCEIFSILNNYQDFYFSQETTENIEEIRFAYCLHMVNHILKTRGKVIHHNARLTKKDDVPEEFRDQGLVRPKVLVVVPFRDAAYRIITMLIDILITEDKGNVINKNRFVEEFTGHEIVMPKKNRKPEDYEQLFKGNTGDDFRIGMTVTKKSLKLFADFYSSDIIIASPLGLRTIIGADGESERDYDFLAAIELLVLDQTEVFTVQNWDHLLHIINHLHLQPKESHGTDFSRVRTWSLNGWAKYYRQTLIFSSIILPEVNAIFNKKCFNYAGKIRTVNNISVGSICQVFLQLPHVFHKISTTDITQLADDRLNFFISKILPQHQDVLMKQTLIFVSSYFDYVRLRNYFKKEDISFVQICEYSQDSKVARARDMFFHGDAHFLLYSERFHFYNRVRIKGIRHLIFYQPPIFPHFYYEMCNLMQEGNMNRKIGSTSNMTVTVLYSKYDVHQLAGVIGTERAAQMVQSDKSVHMLVTDGK